MLAAISPSVKDIEETRGYPTYLGMVLPVVNRLWLSGTLRHATSAKKIRNKPKQKINLQASFA